MLVMFRDHFDVGKVWWSQDFGPDNIMYRIGETIIWAVEDMRFEVTDVRHILDFDPSSMAMNGPRAKQGAVQVVIKKVPSPKRHF